MTNKLPVLTIVIPCYNEEAVIEKTAEKIKNIIKTLISNDEIAKNSYILFIDDGSFDSTWNIICRLNEENTLFKGIKLSRNFGHQSALLAGLSYVKDNCDCCISIDADLQDEVDTIFEMVKEFKKGSEIVYGVRKKRKKDSFFKRFSAEFFYSFMQKIGVNIVHNHADYRLMSSKALNLLDNFQEVNIFLRGIVNLIGLKTSICYYDRKERFAGESKYPLKKMLAFAIDGITSFSITPLRIVSTIGFIVFFISVFMSLHVFYQTVFKGNTVQGWASIVIPVWFLGGIQLISIGLLGEYIGKIYNEVKKRPRFIIEKEI